MATLDFYYRNVLGRRLQSSEMDWNNQLYSQAYDTIVSISASVAATANFKGPWSSLTGPLTTPASVSHSGSYWMLLSNLANVTTETPGVSGSWQLLPSGNVQGPGSSVDGEAVVFDGATGKLVKSGSMAVSRQTSTSVVDYAVHIKSSSGTSNAGRLLISQGATYGLAYAPNSTGSTSAFMDLQWVDIATGAVQSLPMRIRYSGLLETPGILANGSLGIGYMAGAGGTVTQATSRTTGVTLNKASGAITLVSAAGSTSWQSFTLTNSTIAAADGVVVTQRSGTDLYEIHVTAKAAGSCRISFRTTGGTTTEQPVFDFQVIKGATS